ncbi:beta-1,4-glucuronyltransferase 1-like [Musca vetustissima]|uniref:beta-1,4-glucuronyltransferase 1-like n=1 Tax=Musca vetustissima TaxID=27455 RepID=UPI002AB6D449|nr:beta-1,4-glucuronyltransferase 1-like [Musca vetustissima]
MDCAEAVTFTTVADYSYLGHLELIVERWMGPISLALFAPGHDFNATLNAIQYARHCLPISQLIRDYVSFHIYFPSGHMPDEPIPRSEVEALNWPFNCSDVYAPYENISPSAIYWKQFSVDFPINVGRNVARRSANTHFTMAADIELYPSKDFIRNFLEMLSGNKSLLAEGQPHVFAVPAFDLDSHAIIPDNKAELMTLFRMQMAMAMHQKSCKYCRLIGQEKKWLERGVIPDGKFEVVAVVKRFSSIPGFWEPFFVSDNRIPDFDERLMWQGQYDKRMHNYAMCLLGYKYYVLHPAYLTHAPGPKPFDEDNTRMFEADEEILDMVAEYAVIYGINEDCEV